MFLEPPPGLETQYMSQLQADAPGLEMQADDLMKLTFTSQLQADVKPESTAVWHQEGDSYEVIAKKNALVAKTKAELEEENIQLRQLIAQSEQRCNEQMHRKLWQEQQGGPSYNAYNGCSPQFPPPWGQAVNLAPPQQPPVETPAKVSAKENEARDPDRNPTSDETGSDSSGSAQSTGSMLDPLPHSSVSNIVGEDFPEEKFEDGRRRFCWHADGKKLISRDRQMVSPPFEIFPKNPYKIMIQPQQQGDNKGAASFQKAKGIGSVTLKSMDSAMEDENLDLRFSFSISIGEGSCFQGTQGPIEHDFGKCSVCRHETIAVDWNLKDAIDPEKGTFLVAIDIFPGATTPSGEIDPVHAS